MRFLFWNICKKKLFKELAILVKNEDIDVVLIAEHPSGENMVSMLKKELLTVCKANFDYIRPYTPKNKVEIYTRFRSDLIVNIQDDKGVSAKEIYSPLIGGNIILITCHLPSKINESDANQSEIASDIVDFISDVEKRCAHQRTVVCGDLNMNPFEEALVKAKGFNAVMSKAIACKRTRIVSGKEYSFFYNPMWSFFGDLGCGKVSGTMYYNTSDHINYYWNIYDQVLVRPDMIPYFDESKLSIVTNIDSVNLLSINGLIDKSNYSDHLPIIFELNI